MFVIYVIGFVSAVAAVLWIASEILRIYDARKRNQGLPEYGPPTSEELDQVKSQLRAGSVQLGGSSSSVTSRHFARPMPQTRLRGGPGGGKEGLIRTPTTSVTSWYDHR